MLSSTPQSLNHSVHHVLHGVPAVEHLPGFLIVVDVVLDLLQHLLIHLLHLDYLQQHRIHLPIQNAVLATEGRVIVLQVILLDQRRVLCVLHLSQLPL